MAAKQQVLKTFNWIVEVQKHINDCSIEVDDVECLMMASSLQNFVDQEWSRIASHLPLVLKPKSLFK